MTVEVDAHVYVWTPGGMRETANAAGGNYIQLDEVRRLLESAYSLGYWRGVAAARKESEYVKSR